jgi:hypothetical protein
MVAISGCLLFSGVLLAQAPGGKPRPPRPIPPHPADAAPHAAPVANGGGAPADYESAHFLVHTDMNGKEAKALLVRLETMLTLISKYWGRPLGGGPIEMFVVEDLRAWPPRSLDPVGRAKIESGGGVTLTQTLTLGSEKVAAKSVVYAVAQRGVAQHEAVHAYCGQSFGTAGPLWYAEGMAEMGNYWRQDDTAVHIFPVVLHHLQHAEPQTLNDIVNVNSERNMTNDSWQNYAWRWALCHLLANNPNYSSRFRPLGLGFLTEQRVSFEETYGSMAKEIDFEYLFFVKHIDDGFRVELCAWDWKKKSKPLIDETARVRVDAHKGWQASGLTLRSGRSYDYSASGAWQIVKDGPNLSADGDDSGGGRLEGVLFKDFKLSEPFPLGTYGAFEAPGDGQLFLRCRDRWGELADNKGALNVRLRVSRAGDPLPRPDAKDAPAIDSKAPGTRSTDVLRSMTNSITSSIPTVPISARRLPQ